ncbi:MAG: von Willebrand factor type A domain-containing protein [Bacteroidota bacterium]
MRLLLLLGLLLGLYSSTTTSLTGRITDANNNHEPLPYASVVLLQDGKVVVGTNTNIDGNYAFHNLIPDTYDIEVSYTGYETKRLEDILVLDGEINRADIALTQGVSLEEVVVTSYAVPLVEQDNTTQGSTISYAEIQEAPRRSTNRQKRKKRKKANASSDVGQMLQGRAAGVTVSAPGNNKPIRVRGISSEAATAAGLSSSNEGGDINIRGSRNNTVSYYVDGVRVAQAPPAIKEENQPEQYNEIVENAFVAVAEEAISTLSTDVDRAAYANVRRFITQNQMPPADAVRTEEMINYFRYTDPQPTGDNPVAMRTELTECPWNSKHELLRVGVRAKSLAAASVPPANLVFLLDVSGSMSSADKLPLLKTSLKMLANNLRPVDKVSIVVYAGAAGLALPPTPGDNRPAILGALEKLNAGGSTAGGAGIELAYKTATENFIPGGNNRIILATDGDFNVGVSDQEALVKLIEEKRETGVFLTVLGFGRGNYQGGTMQELADRGNGNHAYIDSPAEAQKVLVDEFGGTLYTVAKDVKLQIAFDSSRVAAYRLIGYENRLLNTEDFDDDTKDAAELGAGHAVTVLYEIVPQENASEQSPVGELRLRYKKPEGDESRKMTTAIPADLISYGQASLDIRWAAAVAEFAMLLRDSKYKDAANWTTCRNRAIAAQGLDRYGYRNEMVQLIDQASGIVVR